MDRMASDQLIKPAWDAFLNAGEVRTHPQTSPGNRPSQLARVQVLDAVSSYYALRRACGVPDGAYGRPAFDAVLQATLVAQATRSRTPTSTRTRLALV